MSYQWFRMYAEFATDPVVQSLAFDDQRHFVIVLCLKCSGVLDRQFGDSQQRITMLRRALGLEAIAFDEAKTRLMSARLIDGDWQPVNWAKRQFVSDHDPTARDRKRRQRERHARVTRDVTDASLEGHGPQNQNTESEKEKKGADALVVLHESLPKEAWEEWIAHRREKRLTLSPRALNKQLKLLARFDSATQREMIDTSINAGWEGIFPLKGGAKPQEEPRRGLPTLRV